MASRRSRFCRLLFVPRATRRAGCGSLSFFSPRSSSCRAANRRPLQCYFVPVAGRFRQACPVRRSHCRRRPRPWLSARTDQRWRPDKSVHLLCRYQLRRTLLRHCPHTQASGAELEKDHVSSLAGVISDIGRPKLRLCILMAALLAGSLTRRPGDVPSAGPYFCMSLAGADACSPSVIVTEVPSFVTPKSSLAKAIGSRMQPCDAG